MPNNKLALPWGRRSLGNPGVLHITLHNFAETLQNTPTFTIQ